MSVVRPVLYIVVPCYNEEDVLPVTSSLFLEKLLSLIKSNRISNASRICFINDGSSDSTWNIIAELAKADSHYCGISLSRNRGHQNALLAGLLETRSFFDISISIDCDGQDDIDAMDQMLEQYEAGFEIVYGVRSNRETDTFFKRTTAQMFYSLLTKMGVETVFNHADYRLMSAKAVEALSTFNEVNLFLRGMVPLIGFKSMNVYYARHERIAGKSHYPLSKMLKLATDGITSLSVKPIRLITLFGLIVSVVSFIGVIWAVVMSLSGNTITGWASTTSIICFLSGVQLLSIGVIGEYIGKIYLESKHRPRYIVEKTTWSEPSND